MATMPRPIRLQPETFERLTVEATRHHEGIDSAAERILRDYLPAAGRDRASALATLGGIEILRARMRTAVEQSRNIIAPRQSFET
jgi:plasmid stability protein